MYLLSWWGDRACSPIGRASGAPWSDRPDPNERLDRPALVHGRIGFGDPLEVGLEVEDPAGIDAALEDIGEQVRDVRANRGGAAAQPDVTEEHRGDRHLDAVGDADVADHPAGSG